MLGIGGALQSQFQHRPPSDKHKENVHRLLSSDHDESAKADDADDGEPSSKKRKLEKEEEKDIKKWERPVVHSRCDFQGCPLHEILIEAKEQMNSDEKKNGVTFAMMGSSGCGKSTVIKDVFIDKVFGKEATKSRGERQFIIQIMTQSAKSDAFKKLKKDVLVDAKGLDEDNINFCYHMNENYDKKYNFMFILDDVLDIRHKDLLQRMFLTMRNTNISSMVSLQYPKLIPPSIRTSVYFALFFMFNNDEAIEIAVRGWLARYFPGKTIKEKIGYYHEWVSGADGHNFFLVDNLGHKAYRVDASTPEYMTFEMRPLSTQEQVFHSASSYSRKDVDGGDSELPSM